MSGIVPAPVLRGLLPPDHRGWAWAIAAVLALLLLAYPYHWRVTPDSALYVGLAESLASGKGYVFDGVPHTHGFPGYPLVLAPVVAVTGRSFVAMSLVGRAALVVAAFLVVLVLLRRHRAATGSTGWLPLFAAAGAAFTPASYEWGTYLLTEPVHLAFFVAFLLRLEREADGEGNDLRGSLVTGLVAMGAFLVRPATLAAVGGWFLWRILKRERWRTAPTAVSLGTAVVMALFIGLWLLRGHLQGPDHTGYEKDLSGRFDSLQHGALWTYVQRLVDHQGWVFFGVKMLPDHVSVLFLLATLRGAVHVVRRGVRPLEVVLLTLILGLMVFPRLHDRYLVPALAPLIYLGLVGVHATLVSRSPRTLLAGIAVATAGLIVAEVLVLRRVRGVNSFTLHWLMLLATLGPALVVAALARWRGHRITSPEILGVVALAWVASLALSDAGMAARHRFGIRETAWGTMPNAHWDPILTAIDPLRDQPPDGVILTLHSRVVHLWTGWPTVRPPWSFDPEEVRYVLAETGCFDPRREEGLDAKVRELGLQDAAPVPGRNSVRLIDMRAVE